MDKKKTTNKVSGPQDKQLDNTASEFQRARILAELKKAGPEGRTTIQLREELNVLHPAGRIMELREFGCDIRTVWTVSENAFGYKHRNARYVLIGGGQNG